MKGAVVPALQQRPERLHPVRMRHVIDVLAHRMIDALVFVAVVFNRLVRFRLVGVERRAPFNRVHDETVQGVAVHVRHHLRGDLTGLPILRADDVRLARRTSAKPLLVPVVPVPLLAAEKRLIDFNGTGKHLGKP